MIYCSILAVITLFLGMVFNAIYEYPSNGSLPGLFESTVLRYSLLLAITLIVIGGLGSAYYFSFDHTEIDNWDSFMKGLGFFLLLLAAGVFAMIYEVKWN